VHRLVSAQSSHVDKSEFYELNGEIGWEYIWSAANKFRLDAMVWYYNYSSAPDDVYVSSEFLWGFKIIEYLKIEPGLLYIWNRDGGHFPSGKITISSSGIKFASLELSYIYDLVPFKPEDVYFKKVLDFEDNSALYNYYSLPENLLSARTLHAMFVTLKCDLSFDFVLSVTGLKLGLTYAYEKYYARKNITFRPDHTAGILMGFTSKWVDLDWNNEYQGRRYVDPGSDRRLDWIIWGSFEARVKILETFSLFAKIDNMYDLSFAYRDGYPEPGIVFLAGLKIVI
jgi:hypothetical protein